MAKAQRYTQLLDLIRETKPSSIIEIGTWNGLRAIEMCKVALQFSESVHYIGYDLFEDATDKTDAEEFNIKPHFSITKVSTLLKKTFGDNKHFSFELIKGNTKETLKQHIVDFVFIDGGHTVETIQNDYSYVKESKIIVFDDYYLDFNQQDIDLDLIGANRIVDKIDGFALLPICDPFFVDVMKKDIPSGKVGLALVKND